MIIRAPPAMLELAVSVGELVAYLRAELAAVPKVAESVRQRRAVLKILVSPGGSLAVD